MSQPLRKLKRGWSDGGQQGYTNPFAISQKNYGNFWSMLANEQLDPVAPPTNSFGQICISNAWHTVTEIQVVVAGAWRNVSEVQVVIGGAWHGLTT